MDIEDLETMSGLDLLEYCANIKHQNGTVTAIQLGNEVFMLELLSLEEFEELLNPVVH